MLMTLAMATGIAGCAGIEVQDYAAETPALDLRSYFNGTLDAYGMFQDRSGKVVKRFHVLIEASWRGEVGTLDERFTYSDGTTQRRVWTITRHDAQRYAGVAADVVGEAQGEARGNALRWRYVLALPVGERVWHVDFDDWMFLMDERVMLNRSVMSKFGVRLGEVTLSFVKRDAHP
ncbi:DUF3833 domain-containing protein [Aromatoleum evansii]|uniref:DUF3833 domain-containing protein n=2 Tax=Aromatoleum evansii TaxID=59406 RepID=A0ABZ1ASV5_AROEV|nr:DUF3833 domain-containing protein [Aromatoleum evansii]WRL48975.1 DUF3833 domain-containing protein [Aromatoleum evansii]